MGGVRVSRDTRFDYMEVSEIREPLSCLGDKVGESRLRVLHSHSLPGIPGGNTQSYTVFADDLGDRFDDFEWEPSAVLDGSSVFVRALVRDVLEELIWEVSVGEVELDSVKSGPVDGFIGSVGVPLNVSLDFVNGQRTGSRMGRGHGDGGCANEFKVGILCLEQFNVRGTTEGPKLEEDV